ncbi:MAG: hypothetical protein R2731_11350 [Nocardioides sp.]
MDWLLDAAADLVLGSRCLGCGTPGRQLCADCRRRLPAVGVLAWPSPVPVGLPPPWVVGEYSGLLRALVLAHKERGATRLRPVLGGLLATAVAAAIRPALDAPVPTDRSVLLVPVPSRRSVVRARGYDATRALTLGAARRCAGRVSPRSWRRCSGCGARSPTRPACPPSSGGPTSTARCGRSRRGSGGAPAGRCVWWCATTC